MMRNDNESQGPKFYKYLVKYNPLPNARRQNSNNKILSKLKEFADNELNVKQAGL